MTASSTMVTELQRYQQRLLQSLLLGVFLWMRTNSDQRHKYLPWSSGGPSGIIGFVVLLEFSRSLCQTPTDTVKLLARTCWALASVSAQYAARGCKPKFSRWSLRFELVRRSGADMFGARVVDETQAPVFRWHSEIFGSFLGWFTRKHHDLKLQPIMLNGLEHIWLKASPADNSRKRFVVLFFYGGGYAVLSPRMYIAFCSTLLVAIKQELATKLNIQDYDVDIFLANYRKVPEHRFPVPAEDAVLIYEYFLQHEKLNPSQIIIVGDSAGGGLVLSTLLRVRDGKSSCKPKLPLPLATIVACPLADLTRDEDKIKGQHCVLSPSIIAASINSYRPTHEGPTTWADSSPVHSNLRSVPPVLLQATSLDYLFGH
ncbi:unnamed protein product [Phytophthora fragariaefolia]|uniref:Unnamed protein product n=1 Tax=Phytophthora fragariaefolia TaxID=1490495 RepID=A0A9W6Y911_9STRA|nr:unnamed protein product [Phytophthora fragariaefolia]